MDGVGVWFGDGHVTAEETRVGDGHDTVEETRVGDRSKFRTGGDRGTRSVGTRGSSTEPETWGRSSDTRQPCTHTVSTGVSPY